MPRGYPEALYFLRRRGATNVYRPLSGRSLGKPSGRCDGRSPDDQSGDESRVATSPEEEGCGGAAGTAGDDEVAGAGGVDGGFKNSLS